ncbi:MAG: phosphotransferase family protein [Omnitrophica WOR_2 bacterium]
MFNITKASIPNQTLQDMVTQHFGSCCLIHFAEELKEGFFNTAYFIETTGGEKWVIKIAPPDNVPVLRYEKNILNAEVESISLVKTRTCIPVPNILAYDRSRKILDRDYFVMSYIPGIPFHKLRADLTLEQQREVERSIGCLTREMNGIRGSVFGPYAQDELQFPTWKSTFDHLFKSVLADGQEIGVQLPETYPQIYNLAARHYDVLDRVKIPCLVHWDLWDGNVFVDPVSLRINGVIDFERVMWADPLVEAWWVFKNEQSSYVDGYGLDLLATDEQKLRRSLYNVYLYLIMIIECYFRKYENQNQENWARARLLQEIQQLTIR